LSLWGAGKDWKWRIGLGAVPDREKRNERDSESDSRVTQPSSVTRSLVALFFKKWVLIRWRRRSALDSLKRERGGIAGERDSAGICGGLGLQ